MIDEFKLKEERTKLLARLRQIEKELKVDKTRFSLDYLDSCLKESCKISVKNIGKKCNQEHKIAKQMFWRMAINEGYSAPCLAEYTGDKSRFTPLAGRYRHIYVCQRDWDVNQQWLKYKKHVQKS